MDIPVSALVVPVDSGSHETRMGRGPGALLAAGVLPGVTAPWTTEAFAPPAGAMAEVESAFATQRWLATRVADARANGRFPLVLAGNCMVAPGIFAGLRARSRRVPGVCWFDAHADFNTPETTTSGFLDGMAVATLTGRCWTAMTRAVPNFRAAKDTSVVMIGTRSIDPAERRALDASAIAWPRTPADAARAGADLEALRARCGEVYVHVDLDVIDEREGRANQFACGGGPDYARVLELVRQIGTSFHIGAAAVTAYDPSCDPEGRIPPIARQVVEAIISSVK